MLNKSTSSSKYVVQSGVTQYPIGFEFQYNGNDTPQIRVTIGAMVAEENLHFVISEDLLTIKLIPLEEEAPVDPNDYSWMDKWVGMELVIERDIPFVQESDYQLGRISPERIEKDFDLSVMRDQILADRINEHIEDVQGEVDALHSRIDSVQEEHESDMAAVDSRIDSVQEEHESDIAAIDSRIDYVQEEHELDMFAVDEVMATKATKAELENAKATLSAGLERNAQAIQETRDDMNAKDSQLEATLDSHTGELTTLHGQVSGIESKIPESASVSNQLATKADLAAGLDDYVKKSGDTMTGLLTIQSEEDYDLSTPPVGGLSFKSNASPDGFTNRMRQVGNGFIAIEYLLNGKPYSNLVFGDQGIYVANTENGTGNPVSLGTSGNPWDNVYAKKLNNGADLNIPTKGGTLARLEDLGDSLPDQTDNAGKFLMTDGENISWGNAIKNEAEDPATDIEILTADRNEDRNILIGGTKRGESVKGAVAIGACYGGSHATADDNAVAIGKAARAEANSSTAIGFGSYVSVAGGIAIGNWAQVSAAGSIQLNARYSSLCENNEEGTFCVALGPIFGDGGNYKLLDIDGTIPTNRYAATPIDAGTYVPKLTIAEDGTATREWGAESTICSDYLPLTGGTLTGVSSGSYAFARILTFQSVSEQGEIYGTYSIGVSTEGFALDGAALYEVGIIVPKTNGRYSLGSREKGFLYVNTQKLYNGADLAVPTEGGTLARIEDIDAVVGDISTALTAILGE